MTKEIRDVTRDKKLWRTFFISPGSWAGKPPSAAAAHSCRLTVPQMADVGSTVLQPAASSQPHATCLSLSRGICPSHPDFTRLPPVVVPSSQLVPGVCTEAVSAMLIFKCKMHRFGKLPGSPGILSGRSSQMRRLPPAGPSASGLGHTRAVCLPLVHFFLQFVLQHF